MEAEIKSFLLQVKTQGISDRYYALLRIKVKLLWQKVSATKEKRGHRTTDGVRQLLQPRKSGCSFVQLACIALIQMESRSGNYNRVIFRELGAAASPIIINGIVYQNCDPWASRLIAVSLKPAR